MNLLVFIVQFFRKDKDSERHLYIFRFLYPDCIVTEYSLNILTADSVAESLLD